MISPVVTFLTDYGLVDPFVGQCRAVLARAAPGVPVVDLTHGVPRQDVLAGAVLLADCVPFLPPGVTVAVVDPGVGTARRGIVAEVDLAGAPHRFVAPDNGLVAPALVACGGAVAAWSLPVPPGIPATFHGRDVFAPAAARLATGADPADLGAPVDPATLTPLALPAATASPGLLAAPVLLTDHFGNLSLAAGPADLAAAGLTRGAALRVAGPGPAAGAVLATTFADVAPGGLLVHLDAAGRVAVVVNGGSAAARLGAGPGAEVRISPGG